MKVNKAVVVLLALISPLIAASKQLITSKDTISLVSVVIFSKSKKQQVASFEYFRIKENYYDATVNYPFSFFGCTGISYDDTIYNDDGSLKGVNYMKEKKILKKFSKRKYQACDENALNDRVIDCLKKKFAEHTILIKRINILTNYSVIKCDFRNAKVPSSLICPGVIVENEYVVPFSYDKDL